MACWNRTERRCRSTTSCWSLSVDGWAASEKMSSREREGDEMVLSTSDSYIDISLRCFLDRAMLKPFSSPINEWNPSDFYTRDLIWSNIAPFSLALTHHRYSVANSMSSPRLRGRWSFEGTHWLFSRRSIADTVTSPWHRWIYRCSDSVNPWFDALRTRWWYRRARSGPLERRRRHSEHPGRRDGWTYSKDVFVGFEASLLCDRQRNEYHSDSRENESIRA